MCRRAGVPPPWKASGARRGYRLCSRRRWWGALLLRHCYTGMQNVRICRGNLPSAQVSEPRAVQLRYETVSYRHRKWTAVRMYASMILPRKQYSGGQSDTVTL